MELRAIVYVSASVELMQADALEALLLQARALNLESGVTGVLLHADGQFMQYFEGSPAAVQLTYDRIRSSRRHTRIIEMLDTPIAAREFSEWSMGLAQPTLSELTALSTAEWVVNNSRAIARGKPLIGMALLRDFWSRQRYRG